jgi:hypothetical protein
MESHYKRTVYSTLYENMFFRQTHKLKKKLKRSNKRLCLYYKKRDATDRLLQNKNTALRKLLLPRKKALSARGYIVTWKEEFGRRTENT